MGGIIALYVLSIFISTAYLAFQASPAPLRRKRWMAMSLLFVEPSCE